MKKSIIQLFSFIFVSFFLINAASAGIIIDSPNDVIYSGTFNGTNIFADLIDTSSLIVHSNWILIQQM